MNVKEQLAAALKRAQELSRAASERTLTDEELAEVKSVTDNIDSLRAQAAKADEDAALLKRLGGFAMPDNRRDDNGDVKAAASLGEHFAKHVGSEGFANLKNRGGFTVSAPEFKAATDPQVVPSSFAPLLTEVDRTIVRGYRRPTITSLLSTGTISGNAITYYVEGAVEGAFTTVAEAAQKPQLHFTDPTAVTDSLKKIAAWWDTSDEMAEDLPFWVSEINNRGLYLLEMFEEAQLISGNGTGTNVLGLLNRSGIQTEAQAATGDNVPDTLFRAITKVQTATGMSADSIVINPADYQTLRLTKDANGQYFGGGFFAGEYGVGGVPMQPPLWGLPTVVSAAVPAKTVIVGALRAAATVYRKGGVRVESTNADLGKFTKNIITTRIEERAALAVRIPSAVVKVTLQ